jgi:hypothetical protein
VGTAPGKAKETVVHCGGLLAVRRFGSGKRWCSIAATELQWLMATTMRSLARGSDEEGEAQWKMAGGGQMAVLTDAAEVVAVSASNPMALACLQRPTADTR